MEFTSDRGNLSEIVQQLRLSNRCKAQDREIESYYLNIRNFSMMNITKKKSA